MDSTSSVRPFLKTFGAPTLLSGPDGAPQAISPKDMALLVYLRLHRAAYLSRVALAGLLWGDSTESKARHSLSQALRRLQTVLGRDAWVATRDAIAWVGPLASDASLLDEGDAASDDDDYYLRWYTGDFLVGLALGHGAGDFDTWADAKRATYRLRALRCLQQRSEAAERRGMHGEALQLAMRLVEIEPLYEAGHRCLMRSWRALGERAIALKHYNGLVRVLRSAADVAPDPLTRAVAEGLTGADGADPSGGAGTAPRAR